MKIVLSRTDSIGDVVLSLPVAGYLKKHFAAEIIFLCREYTRAVVEACEHVDMVLVREEVTKNPYLLEQQKAKAIIFLFPDRELASLAYKLKIPLRLGTAHRLHHWLYLNKRVFFSRRRSPLHESQLNFFLLKPWGISHIPSLQEISMYYGLTKIAKIKLKLAYRKRKYQIILHPKSKLSGREWPLYKYYELARALPEFDFWLTGTSQEGEAMRKELKELFALPHVHDFTGKLKLSELLGLIHESHALVAASTGPLHLAAALGKLAIGLFPPLRPIHPGRWAPVGKNAVALQARDFCFRCPGPSTCRCMDEIKVEVVRHKLQERLLPS
ncbi:MAG: glycosyltransferase family 9 protein [Leptospiraceae bacterium]|nr:glycosyltransferase family 9 protein [Leptospiraceae bacterium]MDW8307077.1 glycosyltransferase family 9 protein [Leptospiraceae bacterium]